MMISQKKIELVETNMKILINESNKEIIKKN
jgi:hypothetical protein